MSASTERGAASRESAASEGAVPALVAAMQSHQGSLALQVVACAALRHYAAAPGGAPDVAQAGGIDALLAALRLHGNSAALQEAGCDAISELAVNGGTDIARKTLAAGGLEVCKAALNTRFPNHPGVQRAAKAALDELAPARVARDDDPAVIGYSVAAARSSCHNEYLDALQQRLVGWLGAEGGNSDWLDLVELALTTQWHEWEAGLSTTSLASPEASAGTAPPA